MNFSTRTPETTITSRSPSDLTDEEVDGLRYELAKVQLLVIIVLKASSKKHKYIKIIRSLLSIFFFVFPPLT